MALFDRVIRRFRRRPPDAGDPDVTDAAAADPAAPAAADFPGDFPFDVDATASAAASPESPPPFDAGDLDLAPIMPTAAAPSAPLSVADFDPADLPGGAAPPDIDLAPAPAAPPSAPPSGVRPAPEPAPINLDPARDDLAAAEYQERLLSPPGALTPPARAPEPAPVFAAAAAGFDRNAAPGAATTLPPAAAPPLDIGLDDINPADLAPDDSKVVDDAPSAAQPAAPAVDDHLIMECPYCGMPEQHVGSRCDKCQQVIIRLPSWAQRRRQNWFTRRLSFQRIMSAIVLALIIIFIIWINYPFAPNPLILFKTIQSQLTIDSGPGHWTVSGQNLQHHRYVQAGPPPPVGQIEWRQTEAAYQLGAEGIGERANIYIGSADGMYPLNLGDEGKVRQGWDGDTEGRITAAPALIDTYLYFGSTDHTVNSWDAYTGESRWTFKAADTVETAPIVAQGLLYISSGKGWIYALDAASGDEIWSTQLSSNASAAPALYEGRLLVGDDEGTMYILSARTGQEFSRYRTPRAVTGSPVISADGEHAYFAAGGDLYAISARQREIPGLFQFKQVWAQLWIWQVPAVPRPPGQQGGLWRFGPDNPLLGIKSSPALAEGVLYVGGHDRNMYAIDASKGTANWTFRADDAIWASPLVVRDTLIFGDDAHNLYALNRESGALIWKVRLDGKVRAAPTLINGKLIARTDQGTVYAVK